MAGKPEPKKMGLIAATLMVAGNMMGSGVFMLPASLGALGSISLLGWLVTTAGALMLALVFARLASIDPAAGGPYAYSRQAFGPYIGYQANLVYWVANVIGNVGLCAATVGYLARLFPALEDTRRALAAEIFIIWLFSYANMLGPRVVGFVQSAATIIKLVPILGVALLGWFWFDPQLFSSCWNVSGKSDFSAFTGTITLTLWAFLGVESASVSAAVVKNPRRNVPIATLTGVILAGVCYILSSSVIMGLIPNKTLMASSAPFADAVSLALGPAAGHIIAACAALGCLGSLAGLMLLVSQSAKAAADDGLFVGLFSKTNEFGVPVPGLAAVAIIMSVLALFTVSSATSEQFAKLCSATVILTLMPYLYSCVAIKILAYNVLNNRQYLIGVGAGFLGALFCIAALASSNPAQTRWSLIFVVSTMALYSVAVTRQREIKEGIFRPGGRAPQWLHWLTLLITIGVLFVTFWLTVGNA